MSARATERSLSAAPRAVVQQTGLIWLLFGYSGRISRSQFWMAAAIYLGGLLVSLMLSFVFSWPLFVIFFAGLLVSSLMVGIKDYKTATKATGGRSCFTSSRFS